MSSMSPAAEIVPFELKGSAGTLAGWRCEPPGPGIMRAMGAFAVPPAAVRAAGLPILVGYGDTNDMWTPEVHEQFAAELGARTAVYKGVGHLPNEERPEQVRDDLVAFWRDVESPA